MPKSELSRDRPGPDPNAPDPKRLAQKIPLVYFDQYLDAFGGTFSSTSDKDSEKLRVIFAL